MPQIARTFLPNQLTTPPVLEGWDWSTEIEPKLRATALRQTLVSTQLLALQDPQLNPIATPVADGYAVFHGPGALSSFAREVGTSRPISTNELATLEQFYADHSCPVRIWVSSRIALQDPRLNPIVAPVSACGSTAV